MILINFNPKISEGIYLASMNWMFPLLAKANKLILPSLTKRRVDLAKASRWQILLIGYRYYVTSRALEASNSKSPKN
jgi:carbamoylphosphate synthase large subunit